MTETDYQKLLRRSETFLTEVEKFTTDNPAQSWPDFIKAPLVAALTFNLLVFGEIVGRDNSPTGLLTFCVASSAVALFYFALQLDWMFNVEQMRSNSDEIMKSVVDLISRQKELLNSGSGKSSTTEHFAELKCIHGRLANLNDRMDRLREIENRFTDTSYIGRIKLIEDVGFGFTAITFLLLLLFLLPVALFLFTIALLSAGVFIYEPRQMRSPIRSRLTNHKTVLLSMFRQ